MRCLFGLCAAALAATASAQPPAAGVDKLADDVLKDVHNRGAELYNRGDPAACYRMYQGALLTIRPFLAHRPAAQKALDTGLAEVAKSTDPKVQAFRLHQIIEQVRADLKKSAATTKTTGQPEKKEKEAQKEKQKEKPAAGATGTLSGEVRLDGKPLGGAEVTLVSLALSPPLVFTAKTKADGTYAFDKPLPKGQYVVMITGAKVPEKFQTAGTSELRFNIAGGPASGDFALMSK
jgi:hypothetical protein